MKLQQILVEGVPGAKGALEFPFEPGLSEFRQKGTFQIETLVELLLTLLFPRSKENEPLGPGKSQRASLILEARDQTYRLSRDYVRKRISIAQLEPGGEGKFRELSTEFRFIQETLTRSVHVPSQTAFRSLLIATPGKPVWGGNPGPVVSGDPIVEGETDRSLEDQLATLLAEQENMERIRSSDSRMDELQASIFKIDDELRRFVPLREELARIQSEYDRYRIYDREGLLSPGTLSKLKNFESQSDKRGADLRELEEKAAEWTAEADAIPVHPPWKDAKVLSGSIAALTFLICAGFFRGHSLFLPLLGLFVLGVIWAGYEFHAVLKREERVKDLRKSVRALETEKAGIEKRYEIETSAVRKLMEIVKEKDSGEILSQIKHWEQLKGDVAVAEKALKALEAEVNEKQLMKEREAIQQEVADLQRRLADAPPVSIDPNSLAPQIAELRARIAAQMKNSSPTPFSVSSDLPEGTDALSALLVSMSELTGRPGTEVMNHVQKAVDSNVFMMSGKRFKGVLISQDGMTGVVSADDSTAPWVSLDSEAKTIVYFAAQFTFWQLLAVQRPLPFVMDLISYAPTAAVTKLSLAAARHLAQKTQVVVLAP